MSLEFYWFFYNPSNWFI